jgi:RNA polymerase sigma-70 factor (ECF subfamily)
MLDTPPHSQPANLAALDWPAQVGAHAGVLRQWTRRQLGGEEGLDDVLQEVAIAAMQSENRPDDAEKVLPWLKGVARHKVQDHWRRLGRQERLLSEVATEHATQVPSPHEWVLGVDRVESVREALATLPPEERELLVSKYGEGRSCEQIASRKGITLKSLEYRLAKARETLRARLTTLFSNP